MKDLENLKSLKNEVMKAAIDLAYLYQNHPDQLAAGHIITNAQNTTAQVVELIDELLESGEAQTKPQTDEQ